MNNPNLRILLDSEIYTNSKNFLREIKTHLMSERVTSKFGQFYNPRNWNEGEITIAQRTINRKEASITCSGIGAVKVGQHYDVIIGDDYNSPMNSNTADGRRKVIDHFRMNMSILEPNGIYAIIGTRYAEDDLIGWILKTQLNREINAFNPEIQSSPEMQSVTLICGVPGSGKTWVAQQLNGFNYIPHDNHKVAEYGSQLIKAAKTGTLPVLGEAPFRISVLEKELKSAGIRVFSYFIRESEQVVQSRYEAREGKAIPSQHLANLRRYNSEKRNWISIGTSEEILRSLKMGAR